MSNPNLTPTERIASKLNGKPRGRAQYWACCPAHPDKTPSLSIKEGRDGRCLLWCFAGCRTSEILKTANLDLGDLFPGPSPSLTEQTKLTAERARRDALEREHKNAQFAAARRILQLTRLHDELGKRLACLPDGHPDEVALVGLYHRALALLRQAEAAVAK